MAQSGERGGGDFEHAWSVRRPWRSKSPFFDAIFVLCGADLPGNHLSLARKVPVAALVEAFVCVLTELRKSGARSSNSNFRDPNSLRGINVTRRTSQV